MRTITNVESRVIKGTNLVTGKKYGLKVMYKDEIDRSPELKTAFCNEVRALKNMNHPNIVKIRHHSSLKRRKNEILTDNYGDSHHVAYISLEYLKNGSLKDLIMEQEKLSEEATRYYFLQLLDALEYMHLSDFSHTDIKVDNLMLNAQYNLKVIDFGF